MGAGLSAVPTGVLEPVEAGTLELTVSASHIQDGIETLRFDVPPSAPGAPRPELAWGSGGVRVPSGLGWLFSFTEDEEQGEASGPAKGAGHPARVWVRRRVSSSQTSEPFVADVFVPAQVTADQQLPGRHIQLRLQPSSPRSPAPGLFADYLRALGERSPEDSPLRWLLAKHEGDAGPATTPSRVSEGDGDDLLRASTGFESIEAALQTNQVLRATRAREVASIPITRLRGPELARHPWREMLARLQKPAPSEPLAQVVPADFYFIRAKTFAGLERVIDRFEELASPAFHALSARGRSGPLAARYRAELGLPKTEMSRLVGQALIQEMALVGSDPFVRAGSDLTLVFSTAQSGALVAALEAAHHATGKSWQVQESRLREAQVRSYRAEDGTYCHVASSKVGGTSLVAVSNSMAALSRVLDVWRKASPALADELDFQYMLARDAEAPAEILAFAGDRFIAESMSPAQRILDARRHLAHADLLRVHYSELVFELLYGRAPQSAEELWKAPWLRPEYKKHVHGEPIAFAVGAGASSMFGSPRRLTSLIDLPRVQKVTPSEKRAYEQIAQNYERVWGTRIDPIALRANADGPNLDLLLRVLPVMRSGEYEDALRFSGGGTTARKATLKGLAGILALGPSSPLRQLAAAQGRGFLGQKFDLDWLGSFIELGLADAPAVWDLARDAREVPQPPGRTGLRSGTNLSTLGQLPLYLTMEVKSPGSAALLLTALRKLAMDAAPDALEWGAYEKVKDTTIVRVRSRDLTLFYSLTDSRLHFALSSDVMRRLLEAGPGSDAAPPGGQVNVEFEPNQKESALRLAMAWFLEAQNWRSGRRNPWAELLLLAHPELNGREEAYREAGLRFFGATTETPDGRPYIWGDEGLTDPVRGSAYRPLWPSLPVAGSPSAALLESLKRGRFEVSVEREPGSEEEQSLRVRVQLGLSRP